MDAWDRGELAEAAELMMRAYRLRHRGRTACAIGQIAQELGRRATAILWLQRCAEDENLPADERHRARDEARFLLLERGTLLILDDLPGAHLQIDEQPAGDLVLHQEISLTPGPHRVELVTTEGERFNETVEITGGRRLRVMLAEHRDQPVTRGSTERLQVTWPFWVTLTVTVATLIGAGVALGYDIHLSRGPDTDAADQATLATGILSGVFGVGLAALFILIPYTYPRRERRQQTEQESRQPAAGLGSPRAWGAW